MHIFFVCRLYSGLEVSVKSKIWRPVGAPAIYKILDSVGRVFTSNYLVLTCKESTDFAKTVKDGPTTINGLSAEVVLLAGIAAVPSWTGRLRWYVSEMRQLMLVWRMLRRQRPDLVYVDRGNLLIAGIFARFTGVPVVYRVMGISPDMRSFWDGYRFRQILMRWLLRAPFSHVICTQDGSGGEVWLGRLLSPKTPRTLIFNGVDRTPGEFESIALIEQLPRDRTIVGFVGRLDPIKGCEQFVDAFLKVGQRVEGLHALIVGTGDCEAALRRKVADAGALERFTFVDRVPHHQMLSVYKAIDILVSLNRMGNLSNANLEAMVSGCTMVCPEAQPSLGIDMATYRLFPPDTIWRVSSVDDIEGIAEAIRQLHTNPQERRDRARRIARIACQNLPTWSDRIGWELDLLSSIASARP